MRVRPGPKLGDDRGVSEPAPGSPAPRRMDFRTRLLLGITAFAVLGYVGLVYGGCAADPDCRFRPCAGGRAFCGVVLGQGHGQAHGP